MRGNRWEKIFDYKDGNLIWKIKPTKSRVKIGQLAGKQKPDLAGYKKVGFKLKTYLVHRVIWELHHGPIPKNLVIDHINGNKLDNHIENLRLVTISENSKNRKIHRDGKIIGLCYTKYKKWRVTINFGSFATKEEAEKRIIEINKKLYGDLK